MEPLQGLKTGTIEEAPETTQPSAPARESQRERPPRRDGLWETARSLLIVLVGVFFIRTFIAEATMIPTGSMENTILIGDHVFLDKLLYGPRIPYTDVRLPEIAHVDRQDIVAFPYPVNPAEMFVKRVIGVGGDVIRIVDKKVYVNGKPLKEPYARFEPGADLPLQRDFPPPAGELGVLTSAWGLNPKWASELPRYIYPDGLHVPKGYLFVMGDNRDNSLDSRFWGFVPARSVVGEPLFVYWSYNAPSPKWLDSQLSDRLKFDASIVYNFFDKTRWARIGKTF